MMLTTKQAAQILGLNASRVRQLILSGELPAEKIGRDHAINPDVVQVFKLLRSQQSRSQQSRLPPRPSSRQPLSLPQPAGRL